uniref:Uncharacterized protein n=1 Tax=Anopheles culicifacies TaxID=139723 RepID=A0A182LS33_9DIPT
MVCSFVPVVIILGLVSFSHSTALNGSSNKASGVNSPPSPLPSLEGALTAVLPDEPNADSARFEALTLDDQVRLLSKQLNALTYQRREDYKMLENSLKKYVRKNAAEITDAQIREELDQLR